MAEVAIKREVCVIACYMRVAVNISRKLTILTPINMFRYDKGEEDKCKWVVIMLKFTIRIYSVA